jgi:hypothetical protein
MQKIKIMKEIPDEIILGLTEEEYITKAIEIIEQTLNGLGRDDEYKIAITREINYMVGASYFGKSKFSVTAKYLLLPEDVATQLDKQFDTHKEAVKNFAICAYQFALHHAEQELATHPDEQGWMHANIPYWHKLKDEVIEFKEQYLK